ncbi:ccr4 associated factor [Ascosphaera acerosa]|nr:ccr4 associated factor [Ascosphaera acerosa]
MAPRLVVISQRSCTWLAAHTRRCRHFSSSQCLLRLPPAENATKIQPPPDAGYLRLPNRQLLELTGEDATNFLQGLVMQDMIPAAEEARTPRRMFYTAMLNTRGRVMWDLFVYRYVKSANASASVSASGRPATVPPQHEIAYLIEVERSEMALLRQQIQKRKLRSKVRWRELKGGPDGLGVYAAWTQPTSALWAATEWAPPARNVAITDAFPALPPTSTPLPMTFVDPRGPHLGYRIVGRAAEVDAAAATGALGAQASLTQYQIRRYECGVLEGATEVFHDGSFPMEGNFDAVGAVSFDKGCYVGQELTHRTHHAGVVRKRVLPLLLADWDAERPHQTQPAGSQPRPIYDPDNTIIAPTTGSKLHVAGTVAGRRAGLVIRTVGNVGLGLCQLPVMTDLRLTATPSTYNPDATIITVDPQSTAPTKAVRAFVPPWLRRYIERHEQAKSRTLRH